MSPILALGPPADPGEEFGPTAGVQAVRDGAGPRTVADPGGGTAFNTSSDIQTLIDSNSANTLFVTSTTGTYNNFRGIVYSQKHPRFYFVGAAAGYEINGGSVDGIGLNGTGSGANGGLEVHGGTWIAYGHPTGTNVSVFPINIGGGGGDSVIADAIFTANNQSGLSIFINAADSGTRATMLVTHCTLSSNGRYGMPGSSTGTNDNWFYTPTLEYCIIDGNNTRGFEPGDDTGGQKFGYSTGGNWRYNWYKNNEGHSCWLDGYNRNATIAENVIENNNGLGIFYEISRGGSVIEHNYLLDNGDNTDQNYPFNATQITVSCSPCDATGASHPGPDVTSEVRYNDADASGYATACILYDHSGQAPSEQTRNWYVHHNRLWQRAASGVTGRCGLADPHNEDNITDVAANNLFDFNEYHVADDTGAYWEADGSKTFAQFQAAGHEANGSVVEIV